MMNILNHPELAGFYSLAAVAIFASLRVVTQANPVHAILSMIVSLLAIAGIFLCLVRHSQARLKSWSTQALSWCCLSLSS